MSNGLKIKVTNLGSRDSHELPFDTLEAAADHICALHDSISQNELTGDLIKGFPIHLGNFLYRRVASNNRNCEAFSDDLERLAILDPKKHARIREAYDQVSKSLRVLLTETQMAELTLENSSGEFLEEHLCILGALESLNTGTLGLILQDCDCLDSKEIENREPAPSKNE